VIFDMRGVDKLTKSRLLQFACMNDLQPMVIKLPYAYMPVYNQSSKRGLTFFPI